MKVIFTNFAKLEIEDAAAFYELEYQHPNQQEYPGQRIMVVGINNNAYLVPYIEDKDELFLKTIIPSRKATEKYLGGKQ